MNIIKNKSKILISFIVALILIAPVWYLHFVPVKSFGYHTSGCFSNLDPRPVHLEYSFRTIQGGNDEYEKAIKEIKKLNMPQDYQQGCDYDTATYRLYFL